MNSIKNQRNGLSPIENPYVINEFGYVSQESAGLYEKFMSKYCNVEPEGYYLGPPSTKEMKELKEKKKPLKSKTPGRRKKVKSKELISDDDDDDGGQSNKSSEWKTYDGSTFKVVLCSDGDEKPKVPKIKILLPVRREERAGKHDGSTDGKQSGKENQSRADVRGQAKCRRRASNMTAGPAKRHYVPAPLSFEELLKLAEKKQHEPVIVPGYEYETKRPMTQKEKALYLQKMERIKKRKEDKEMQREEHNHPTRVRSEAKGFAIAKADGVEPILETVLGRGEGAVRPTFQETQQELRLEVEEVNSSSARAGFPESRKSTQR